MKKPTNYMADDPIPFIPFPFKGSCLKCHSEESFQRRMTKNLWVGRQCTDNPHHTETLRYAQGDINAVLSGQSPFEEEGAVNSG